MAKLLGALRTALEALPARVGRRSIAALGVVIVVAASTVSVLPSSAQDAPPPPILVELLTARAEFTDDVHMTLSYGLHGHNTQSLDVGDPSRIVTAKITVQPGAQFPWHTHPGPVIVSVVQGKLIYVMASDCVKRPYREGEMFLDPGYGMVHTAYNGFHAETVIIATFFGVPASGPLTITEGVQAPANCKLH